MKKQTNISKKSYVNLLFGFCYILGIANTHLCAKNQKKLMTESRKNAKSRSFRHISGIFCQEKPFSKIRLRYILGITILHLCVKNQRKLMSQTREKMVTDVRTDERTRVDL